eukprot:maker-scaffold72_size415059-snap-gene-2.22 protein:Tk08673 transcript:maker-scaffold72_size415059-snap-gene-2.22-mRNA-1 annotation:"protein with dexdc plus ring plus helicc possible snf2 domain"
MPSSIPTEMDGRDEDDQEVAPPADVDPASFTRDESVSELRKSRGRAKATVATLRKAILTRIKTKAGKEAMSSKMSELESSMAEVSLWTQKIEDIAGTESPRYEVGEEAVDAFNKAREYIRAEEVANSVPDNEAIHEEPVWDEMNYTWAIDQLDLSRNNLEQEVLRRGKKKTIRHIMVKLENLLKSFDSLSQEKAKLFKRRSDVLEAQEVEKRISDTLQDAEDHLTQRGHERDQQSLHQDCRVLMAICPLVGERGREVGDGLPSLPGPHCLTANSLTANSLTANSLTANSLTANSLTANSLTANSLTANSLTANSLTANSLTANSLTANSLTANSLTANSLSANSLTASSLTANSLRAEILLGSLELESSLAWTLTMGPFNRRGLDRRFVKQVVTLQHQPHHWLPMDLFEIECKLMEVKKYSAPYYAIDSRFRRPDLELITAYHVQNPFLYGMYMLRKEQLAMQLAEERIA